MPSLAWPPQVMDRDEKDPGMATTMDHQGGKDPRVAAAVEVAGGVTVAGGAKVAGGPKAAGGVAVDHHGAVVFGSRSGKRPP